MRWVTRERPKTDRVACPWLIARFIDPEPEFLFVPRDQVLEVAEREGAIPYDVPGVELGHHGGKCSFEAFVAKYGLTDPALLLLTQIIHGADVAEDAAATPQSAGLRALGEGFLEVSADDHELLRLQFPVYDALYAWCRGEAHRVGASAL